MLYEAFEWGVMFGQVDKTRVGNMVLAHPSSAYAPVDRRPCVRNHVDVNIQLQYPWCTDWAANFRTSVPTLRGYVYRYASLYVY